MIPESYDLNMRCHYCFRRLISALTPPGTPPFYATQEDGARALRGRYGIATSDHRLARAQGGKDGVYNRVPCCLSCNHKKADRPYAEFYAEMGAIRALNQLDEAIVILVDVVGAQLVGKGKPLAEADYQIARRLLRRARHHIRTERTQTEVQHVG